MIIQYDQFKELLPYLDWSAEELAEKLSLAGHETELLDKGQLDITLTTNRRDCRDLNYLVFDLAGVYGLKTIPNLITFGHQRPIPVTVERINRLLGSTITHADLISLERLGFSVTDRTVTPPDFREIETLADVSEEVVRQIGFAKLSIQPLSKQESPPSVDYHHLLSIKIALFNCGLTETLTSSFTKDGIVEVKDPFSRDEPFLRANLLDGLLKTLARNPFLKRAVFFEIGDVFTPNEETKLGIIVAGYKNREDWQSRISQALGRAVEFTDVDLKRAGELDVKQNRLGYVEASVETLKPRQLERPRFFELTLGQFGPISKYPSLVRDLSLELSNQSEEQLLAELKTLDGLLFAEAIDRYQNNVTFRLLFQKMSDSFSSNEIKSIDGALERFQSA